MISEGLRQISVILKEFRLVILKGFGQILVILEGLRRIVVIQKGSVAKFNSETFQSVHFDF